MKSDTLRTNNADKSTDVRWVLDMDDISFWDNLDGVKGIKDDLIWQF